MLTLRIRFVLSLLAVIVLMPTIGALGESPQQSDLKELRKAAEQGDADAQFNLGRMYDYGRGVTQDEKEAIKWYRKAAEQGDAHAQAMLGWRYLLGYGGVAKDEREAVKWFRKGAEQGHAKAQFNLAMMYAEGQGVSQDDGKACEWFRKAAEQGHAEAQSNLGLMYRLGRGVTQDYKEAIKWYRKAAEQGFAGAQFNLGVMYDNGQGVSQDYKEASEWYRKAAEQGDADAQFNLGVLYANGEGVMRSGAAAADWYHRAGMTYLRDGKKEDALRCVERIRNLKSVLDLTVPNIFLADKLMQAVYGKPIEGSPKVGNMPEQSQEPDVTIGTAWTVPKGYVITNYHVVRAKNEIVLLLTNGTKLTATVAMQDRANDLVLLKVADTSKLPPALPLASEQPGTGEEVFTIGYPHPDVMGAEPKLTTGVISSTTGLGDDPRVYQISVPLQSGNSGGPLLNMRGEVVGIVSAKLRALKMAEFSGDLTQNVNYAVKTAYLSALLSSVPNRPHIRTLQARKSSLSELASRIKDSVMIVVAR